MYYFPLSILCLLFSLSLSLVSRTEFHSLLLIMGCSSRTAFKDPLFKFTLRFRSRSIFVFFAYNSYCRRYYPLLEVCFCLAISRASPTRVVPSSRYDPGLQHHTPPSLTVLLLYKQSLDFTVTVVVKDFGDRDLFLMCNNEQLYAFAGMQL